MTYVYRVQNEYGRGCYKGSPDNWALRAHIKENGQPAPWDDGLDDCYYGDDLEDHLFGFRSLRELQAWFLPQELSNLAKLGFKPTRVKGQLVDWSKHQCIFIPE